MKKKLSSIPNLIDIQVNGGFGIDLAREPARVEELAKKLYKQGVKAFLPTLVSIDRKDYEKILPHFKPRKILEGAEILGAHLEGPYLNPDFHGAHDPVFFLPPNQEIFLENVTLMTLAPELKGADKLIHKLRKKGIIVSAGHTDATYAQLKELDIKMVTHLFNAMRPFQHRDEGIIQYALNEDVFFSLIADGKHVSSKTIQLCLNANKHKAIFTTDASMALGTRLKSYTLGSREFTRDALAGSDIPLYKMVQDYDCLAAATTHPTNMLHQGMKHIQV